MNILFSCIGFSDLKAAKAQFGEGDPGPVFRALSRGKDTYDQLVLLSDKSEHEGFHKQLEQACNERLPHPLKPFLEPCGVNPMDRPALYKAMQAAVDKHSTQGDQRTYLLSAGTPAMQLCWTLLGHSERYRARLLESSREEGIKEVPHWIELAHAFIPALPPEAGRFFSELGQEVDAPEIIGTDPALQRAKGLAQLAAKAGRGDYPVLIYGETGTGKESIARLIHRQSPQPQGKQVSANCGALSESLLESELFGHVKGAFTGALADKKGLFEAAGAGGTVFLDEIGDMPAALQIKLLRVVQEKTVTPVGSQKTVPIDDVRIVAATHKDLREGVAQGWFREDLYYRLHVVEIHLPPLRERKPDIKALADFFLGQINENLLAAGLNTVVLTDDAMQPLLKHDWPGNIRELQNTLRRAALYAQRLGSPEHSIDAALLRELIQPPIPKAGGDAWGGRTLDSVDLDALQDDMRYHYYHRFLRELPGLARGELARRMGLSEPKLRELEDAWARDGRKTASRQTRVKRSKTE